MADIHILVITTVHVPSDARILHRQIRSLLDAGHEVTYAAAFSDRGQREPTDMKTINLPLSAGRRRTRSLVAARRVVRRLGSVVDLIMLHDPELLLAVTGMPNAAPVVLDVHEDVVAALTDKAWIPLRLQHVTALFLRRLERAAEGRCHLILAEDAYRERFQSAHPVIPNLPWRRPAPSGIVYRRAVYLGRVSHARGAEELLEVGAHLRQCGIELIIIGPADAEVREQLEVADRTGDVRWAGYVPNPEALRLVDGAVAGLSLLHDHPNYRHSMPTKVLEYMERGVPVVTTPLPLSQRIVLRHGCGTIVPFRDAAAATAAVIALHTDPAQRDAMATRARRAAIEHYTWDSVSARFVSTLESWAQEPRAGRRQ